MNQDIDYDKVDKEFCKVLKASNGSGDNHTVYNLIAQYGCTADDVVGVAKRTKNEFYSNQLANGWSSRSNHFITRELHKRQFSGRRGSDLYNVDGQYMVAINLYKWCLRYIPDEYLEDVYTTNPATIYGLTNLENKYNDESAKLCVLNKICKRLFEDEYLGSLLNSRLLKNKELLDTYLKTSPFLHITFPSSCSISTDIVPKINTNYYSDKCASYHTYDENGAYIGTKDINKSDAKQVLDLIAQIYVLCLTMANEVHKTMFYNRQKNVMQYKDESRDIDCDVRLYTDLLFNHNRRGGVRGYNNNASDVRVELFGQARTLEMLLSLGLGIRVKDNAWGRDMNVSNKRLNNRIKSAYNTFLRLKTVDERKNFRKLFKEQLSIIANDYMRNGYEIVELKCVEEQDKAFEDSLSKPKKKTVTINLGGAELTSDFLSKIPTVKL